VCNSCNDQFSSETSSVHRGKCTLYQRQELRTRVRTGQLPPDMSAFIPKKKLIGSVSPLSVASRLPWKPRVTLFFWGPILCCAPVRAGKLIGSDQRTCTIEQDDRPLELRRQSLFLRSNRLTGIPVAQICAVASSHSWTDAISYRQGRVVASMNE
jgi:hypothetical protein